MSYTKKEQQLLLKTARDSIRYGLEKGKPLPVNVDSLHSLPRALKKKRATFVTLHGNNNLRGCIGTIAAKLPLAEDIAQRAYSAAFEDYRFPPVEAQELDQLRISISILSPPEALTFTNEADLLAQIKPDRDGLILEEAHHTGVFLPSVWEMLPDKQEFLNQLKHKAGLADSYWSDTVKVYRYYTEYFSD